MLRVEDVDVPRTRPGAEAAILQTLDRLGFEWDGPVWRQSSRTDAYEAALDALRTDAHVYPCACTRAERAADRIGRSGERVYPGICRPPRVAASSSRSRRALRFRVDAAPVTFTDRLYGAQRQRLDVDVGDFVLRRSDGLVGYQLAVVVDDAAQRITDIVRGADLLTSTPRQIALQRALGLATPRYLHVPVAVDARGRKLSKSTGAMPLAQAPLRSLIDAWRFLDQRDPDEPPTCVAEFWAWARTQWDPSRLAPVPVRAHTARV